MPLEYSHVTTAAALVTLSDVKLQLRITDSGHDAEITQIYNAAQDAILFYLANAADPEWTSATAPKPVRHSILLLTTHYYEHRGDDMAPDADVWTAIGQLLGMSRDPTLA